MITNTPPPENNPLKNTTNPSTNRSINPSKTQELSLDKVLDYEKRRYTRKGYGIIFATLITLIWFFLIPNLSQYLWPYKLENPGVFFFLSSYILHESVFLLNNFVMWVIYKLEWSFFENYKIHDVPWPWKKDVKAWDKLMKDTIMLLSFNHVIILPLLSIHYYITNESPFRTDFESLPTCWEVLWQTIFFMVCDDFTFYWSHRFLHWDKIYPYIHKIHHNYVTTVSIASEYAHPLEFVVGNVITSNFGLILLGKRMHLFTAFMWVILRVSETTDGHSGYEFSWSPFRLLPMSGSSEFHNYHHLSFKGNYASFFTYMDRIFGTVNTQYEKFVSKKRQYASKKREDESGKKKSM